MAVYSSPSYRFAGEGPGQDRIVGATRSKWRRRGGVIALRVHLPWWWKRVGRFSRGVAAGRQGKRQGGTGGLPQLDRHISIGQRPRDRRGTRRLQPRRAEPRQHVPPRPIA